MVTTEAQVNGKIQELATAIRGLAPTPPAKPTYPSDRATYISRRDNWATGDTVVNALCADGQRRTATITNEADSFSTLPARVIVRYRGKRYTVSGCVYAADLTPDDSDREDHHFTAYTYLKNAAALAPSGPSGIPCVCGKLATADTGRCLDVQCIANVRAQHKPNITFRYAATPAV